METSVQIGVAILVVIAVVVMVIGYITIQKGLNEWRDEIRERDRR